MSEKQRELYHDGALCPECQTRTGVPDIPEGADPCVVPMGYDPAGADISMDEYECGSLRCASCDHQWTERHSGEIARAWFAHGAYEQSQQVQQDDRAATLAWIRRAAGKAACSFGDGSLYVAEALDALANEYEDGSWKEKTDDER